MSLPVEMETCTHALDFGLRIPLDILFLAVLLAYVIHVMTSLYILHLNTKQKNKETRKK